MAQARKSRQDEPENQAPPENPDAAVMQGGPGMENPEPEAAPEPEYREVKINGRTFQVPPELAQTLEERERGFDRTLNEKLSQRDRELRELRARLPQPPPPSEPNFDSLLYEDPKQFVSQLENRIVSKLTGLYNQEKGIDNFWRTFYREHQDISESDDGFIARAILNERFQELAPMNTIEASKALADLTRRELLRISQKQKGTSEETPTNRTRVEGGGASLSRPARQEPQEPTSLSQVIRQRRQARMAAKSVTR